MCGEFNLSGGEKHFEAEQMDVTWTFGKRIRGSLI